jgi:hypothetical protein
MFPNPSVCLGRALATRESQVAAIAMSPTSAIAMNAFLMTLIPFRARSWITARRRTVLLGFG